MPPEIDKAPLRVVCAVGAESTGKTTLCRRLAKRFDVPWLAEYAREYFSERRQGGCSADGHDYQSSDVATIAGEQIRRERALLERTAAGVVLDTDLAVVLIWWQEKFGPAPAWIEAAFAAQSPRLYLLCRPDLPWQADPLRELPDEIDRQRLHERYKRLLSDRQLPFVEIGGSGEARFEAACAAVRRCLAMPTSAVHAPS